MNMKNYTSKIPLYCSSEPLPNGQLGLLEGVKEIIFLFFELH
jgi:hypothetical protein